MRLVRAHPATEVSLYQTETVSQQLRTILFARAETQSPVLACNALTLTGSMEPDALLSTHFAPHQISKTVNASAATLVTRLLVEAVESPSEIPTVKTTIMPPTLAESAH